MWGKSLVRSWWPDEEVRVSPLPLFTFYFRPSVSEPSDPFQSNRIQPILILVIPLPRTVIEQVSVEVPLLPTFLASTGWQTGGILSTARATVATSVDPASYDACLAGGVEAVCWQEENSSGETVWMERDDNPGGSFGSSTVQLPLSLSVYWTVMALTAVLMGEYHRRTEGIFLRRIKTFCFAGTAIFSLMYTRKIAKVFDFFLGIRGVLEFCLIFFCARKIDEVTCRLVGVFFAFRR